MSVYFGDSKKDHCKSRLFRGVLYGLETRHMYEGKGANGAMWWSPKTGSIGAQKCGDWSAEMQQKTGAIGCRFTGESGLEMQVSPVEKVSASWLETQRNWAGLAAKLGCFGRRGVRLRARAAGESFKAWLRQAKAKRRIRKLGPKGPIYGPKGQIYGPVGAMGSKYGPRLAQRKWVFV